MIKNTQYTSHKNLAVYQKAMLLSVNVVKHFSKQRLYSTQKFVVIQLLKSVTSISANIAEGYGRYYKKSYRQFLSISRGSSFETEYWLELLLEVGWFDSKMIKGFLETNSEIIKMLTTMMKKLDQSS